MGSIPRFALAFLAASVSAGAAAKTVVIADVGSRSEKNLAVFEAAVKEAGHEVRKLKGITSVLEKPESYDGADVIVMTGGWNDGGALTRETCRRLVDFAAGGGGVFLGAFRGGPVRTCGYTAFPEVAGICNRVNSPWLRGVGENPIAKAFGGRPAAFGGFDHLVAKVGPKGTVFAKCGEDTVGAYGEVGLGRVIVFGAFLAVPEDDVDLERKKAIYREMVKYLAGAPAADGAAQEKARAEALAAFDRRMAIHDWTIDDGGDGRGAGVIPGLRDNAVIPVESRAMLLEFFARELKGTALAGECSALAARLREVSSEIRAFADAEVKGVLSRIESLRGDAAGREKEDALRKGFAAIAAKSPDAAADALVEKCRTALRASRKAALAAEHREDVALLPSLVSSLASGSAASRLEAATELGRIGEATREVVSALVSALDDADDRVRVQAAISLGWMQARDAVPALIAKAHQNGDMPLKRRAVQALGQIGDGRAETELLSALDSFDRYTVDNAIFALGFLKSTAAVPRLVEIASDESRSVLANFPVEDNARPPSQGGRYSVRWNMPVMNRRTAAIVALGYIGDKSAVPALEKIAREHKAIKEDACVPFLSIGASLNWFAKDALATIVAGGRREKGVRQPEALASREAFYALTKKANNLAGRIGMMTFDIDAFCNDREYRLLPYLLDAGLTGIHAAWNENVTKSRSAAAFDRLMRDMDDFGLSFVGILPTYDFGPVTDVFKGAHEAMFARYGDMAAFAGSWSEENYPAANDGFSLNENPDPGVCDLGSAARAARVARFEARGRDLDESWRETQDWLHGRRKGFAMTFSLTEGSMYRPIGGQAALSRFDVPGCETYESFGRFTAYFAERMRDGEARPAITEYYQMYSPSDAHVERGFWVAAVHSKCFFPFGFNHIGPFRGRYDPWAWGRNRWSIYAKVARHVRDNKELYAVSPSAAKVAVVLSERSAASFRYDAQYRAAQMLESVDQDAFSTWVALAQSHVQADVVFIDTSTDEKLAKYRTLFLATAKILTDAEQERLRKWVAAGGTLVCSGTVSLFDPVSLYRRGDYAIADLLGVNYVKTDFAPTKDVIAERRKTYRGKTLFPVEQGLDNFFHFEDYIWRDVKPTDCVVAAKDAALGAVEYDAALGIDRVELAGAKAVQTFSDGSPALTLNEYGKGAVYLFTPLCPAYGHTTSRWEMKPTKFDFWPGVRETYGKIARDGLARAGAEQAVDLVGASKDVELTAYSQAGGKRLVVHLLDYDVKSESVSGASLRINGTRPVKAVYRLGAGSLAHDGRMVALGTFNVYDMVVVEFE